MKHKQPETFGWSAKTGRKNWGHGGKGFQRVISEEKEEAMVQEYLATDISRADLAKKYDVSVPTLQRAMERRELYAVRNPVIPQSIRQKIVEECKKGRKRAEVADEFGVDLSSVYNILGDAGMGRKRSHKHEAKKCH